MKTSNTQFLTMKSIVNAAMKADADFSNKAFAIYERELRHAMDVLSLGRRAAEDRADALFVNEAFDLILANPEMKRLYCESQ